jgi:cellulose 1,4-beta-cellobiosidase
MWAGLVNPAMREAALRTLAHAETPAERAGLAAMARSPSAFWIDTSSRIRGAHTLDTLEGVLANASATARLRGAAVPQLCVFILYNLPHRDCHAQASRGELSELREYV